MSEKMPSEKMPSEQIPSEQVPPAPAAHGKQAWPEGYDGRFGERFDAEVDNWMVIKVIIGTGLICLAAILIILAIEPLLTPADATEPAPVQLVPVGPRLQAYPAEELIDMRRQEAAHLGARVGDTLAPEGTGYGWIDESAGIAHIPIATAMELYLEEQRRPAAPANEPATEPAAEQVPELPADTPAAEREQP